MIVLLLGVATLLVLMAALGMFSRAQIDTLKSFGEWIVALGGLVLAALLFLTGRGPTAIAALAMLGPLVWSWMGDGGRGATKARPGAPRANGAMSRAEAYEVLGLKPGATAAEIKAAHLRLMRAAHPDSGGSDWLATRINQARDVLLS
jgi:DnaJ homolog subfamily C member 19